MAGHYLRTARRGDDVTVTGRRLSSTTAVVVGVLVLALAILAGVATASAGADRSAVLHGLTPSNTILGAGLAAAGWPIAYFRPRNALGWLLLAGGFGYVVSGAGYALLAAGTSPGEHAAGWRVVATVTDIGWPWAVASALPAVLLLFPDGRLPSRRWRWLVGVIALSGVLLGSICAFSTTLYTDEADVQVHGYGSWVWFNRQHWVGPLWAVAMIVAYVGAIVALVLRYRRGDDRVRQQILWPLWGGLVTFALFVANALFDTNVFLSIYPVLLVPACVSVAVLRYRLLDIRLVISRSLLYVLLSALAVGAYLGVVAATDSLLRGAGPSLLAALVVAAAFNPVRVILQRLVDRLFYGARGDPVRALAAVGARLEEPPTAGLSGVLEGLCQVMRLPWACLTVDGREIASYGAAPERRHAVSLRQGGDVIGELTVGLRPGEYRLDPADDQVLRLLSTSLAVAVQATLLAGELGRARGALVATREEERRRIRRDLHDGLGPELTAVVLKADVARRLTGTDPAAAAAMMTDLRLQATEAIGNVRRLVHELRPPALDGLGLVGALRAQAAMLTHRFDGVPLNITVEAAEPFALLPAAVEVAAYRIATEALTNVTRHATATAANVELQAIGGQLCLIIHDNGTATGPWRPGVGLGSIHDRAVELGGSCDAGPHPTGGRVHVTIPLAAP